MAQRIALLLGNDRYHDPTLAQLRAPQADLDAFAAVLRDPQRGAFDNVQTLHNSAQEHVRREIARFFHDRQRDDLLLLYFSGHGILDEEGQLYLATPDTERNLLDATAITAHYVNRLMRRCRSRRQVLILDCCHSGAFDRSAKSGGLGAEVAIGEAFAGDGTGHIVLAASKATEYAFEGDEVRGTANQSIFTHALVEGLRSGDADLDENGYITPEELYDYAFRRVREVSPRQTPGKWVYEQTGELVLARSPRRHLPDDLQALLASTDPLVRFRAVDQLALVMHDEEDLVSELARQTLQTLADADDSFTVKRAAALALQSAAPQSEAAAPQPAASTVGARLQPEGGPYSPLPQMALTGSGSVPVARATAAQSAALVAVRELALIVIAWSAAGLMALVGAYSAQDGDAFLLAAAFTMGLAYLFTYVRLLQWAGGQSSVTPRAVAAAALGLIPPIGAAIYGVLLLQDLLRGARRTGREQLYIAAYAIMLAATHIFLLYLGDLFYEEEHWWSYEADELIIALASAIHGAAIFAGARLFARGQRPVSRL